MLILYCQDPLNSYEVEEVFLEEARAAEAAGFQTGLIDFDVLQQGETIEGALRKLPRFEKHQSAIYRGWMLKPPVYEMLYYELRKRKIELINAPEQYRLTHMLPGYYRLIEEMTPRSIWLEPDQLIEPEDLLQRLDLFQGGPVIVKDYVKSCKHDWFEACYTPDSSSLAEVMRVVNGFLERQGDDLNGNLVFREYLDFKKIGEHPVSKMPLTCEYRLFVMYGKVIDWFPYWPEVVYDANVKPPVESDLKLDIHRVISEIKSNFFTLDIALAETGEWKIIELGDGQVSPPLKQISRSLFIKI
ncbi:MAG: ATP-grasp domain-containing protein [Planctomycetaceae bacterium]